MSGVSRELTHEKLEVQRKQLPTWYPLTVWNEIEDAIDQIDLPAVALPIYRKYFSAELTDRLIRFFATKPGQDMVEVFLEQVIQSQHADSGGKGSKILAQMTPSQRAEAESLGAEYKWLQPTIAQIQKEYSKAIIDKQMELARSIATDHQSEIADVKRQYEASHQANADSNSTSPEQH